MERALRWVQAPPGGLFVSRCPQRKPAGLCGEGFAGDRTLAEGLGPALPAAGARV